MIKIIKKVIKKFLRICGYEIRGHYPELSQMSFDEIYQKLFDKNDIITGILTQKAIIFDVGADKGQSIERLSKLFKEKQIHSFEPIKFKFLNLEKKYSKYQHIHLNNYALGERSENKEFYVNHYTGSSSFLKIKENTAWLKLRSKQWKILPEEFLKKKENIEINTVDNYCNQNNINEIDIIKIDTQGYEDKVLIGCKQMIEKKRIKFIELEIIFSDLYEKTLSISDIENKLKNNYRLFANDFYGNLYSNKIYQLNLIYINKDFYKKII